MSAPTSKPTPTAIDCRLAVLGREAKLTPHRRAVFQALAESTDHPTALDLFARIKDRTADISLATIYNCLDHLTTHGLIKPVQLERGQTRYCANLHEHVHFHCEKCGRVTDALPTSDFQPAKLWQLPPGTKISRTDVAIHGLCTTCAQ